MYITGRMRQFLKSELKKLQPEFFKLNVNFKMASTGGGGYG